MTTNQRLLETLSLENELIEQHHEITMESLQLDELLHAFEVINQASERIEKEQSISNIDSLSMECLTGTELSTESNKFTRSMAVVGQTIVKIFKFIYETIKSIIKKLIQLAKSAVKFLARMINHIKTVSRRSNDVSKSNEDGQFMDGKTDGQSFLSDEIDHSLSIESASVLDFPTAPRQGNKARFFNLKGADVVPIQKQNRNVFQGRHRPVIKLPTDIIKKVTSGKVDTAANLMTTHQVLANVNQIYVPMYLNCLDASEKYIDVIDQEVNTFERLMGNVLNGEDMLNEIGTLHGSLHNKLSKISVVRSPLVSQTLPSGQRMVYVTSKAFNDKTHYGLLLETVNDHVYDGDGYTRLGLPSYIRKYSDQLTALETSLTKDIRNRYNRLVEKTKSVSEDIERIFKPITTMPKSEVQSALYNLWWTYLANEALLPRHLTNVTMQYQYLLRTLSAKTRYLSYHLTTYENPMEVRLSD